jgi:hypothetical protein
MQYAGVLAELSKKDMKTNMFHQDVSITHNNDNNSDDECSKRENYLCRLRELEAALIQFYPSSSSSLTSSSSASTLPCVVGATLLTEHSKHAYLLDILNELKQNILSRRPDGAVEEDTIIEPVVAFIPPLISNHNHPVSDSSAYTTCSSTTLPSLEKHDFFPTPMSLLNSLELNMRRENNNSNSLQDVEGDEEGNDGEHDECDDETPDNKGGGKRVKRLNKSCTTFLTAWLLQNIDNPFPSLDQKIEMAKLLRLEPAQVTNFMTNMRKRFYHSLIR